MKLDNNIVTKLREVKQTHYLLLTIISSTFVSQIDVKVMLHMLTLTYTPLFWGSRGAGFQKWSRGPQANVDLPLLPYDTTLNYSFYCYLYVLKLLVIVL